jgi:hypothetical protein
VGTSDSIDLLHTEMAEHLNLMTVPACEGTEQSLISSPNLFLPSVFCVLPWLEWSTSLLSPEKLLFWSLINPEALPPSFLVLNN